MGAVRKMGFTPLAEAAERYSATYVPYERLEYKAWEELEATAISPERLVLFTEFQLQQPNFPYQTLDRSSSISWALGTCLTDESIAHAPAQFIYLGYRHRPDEPHLGDATSSGLACGQTAEDAVLSGLLEIIERDAFMITWMNRLSLPHLNWAVSDRLRQSHRRYYARASAEYNLLDLSCFSGVPVVLAVVRDPEPAEVGLAVGAAADMDVEAACLRALREAFQTYSWARTMVRDLGSLQDKGDVSKITNFDDHVAYHASPERATASEFLEASTESVAPAEVPSVPGATAKAKCDALIDRLAARDISVYAFDVTSPDIKDAGLHVVRVFSPELCWLDASYAARFLGRPRLSTAAYELGLVDHPLSVDEYNDDPHPFP